MAIIYKRSAYEPYDPGTAVPPRRRAFVKRKVLDDEHDPLPWPPGQAYRIAATVRECRPGRLSLEVLDAIVIPLVSLVSPDSVPSVRAASPAARTRENATG